MRKMHDVKTTFNEYICFGTAPFDTTPKASTDDGVIDLNVVTLDGSYTSSDLEAILKEMPGWVNGKQKKRYLLFTGHHYDALGGAHDLKRDFIRWESAMAAGKMMEGRESRGCDWWHVFDTETGKVIAHSGYCHSCPNGGDYVEHDGSSDKP